MPTLEIEASDVTRQNRVTADLPMDLTVGEMLKGLVDRMGLQRTNSNGQPIAYYARLEREGRHLNRSERCGDAMQPKDRITLQANVDAGGTTRMAG